MSGLCREVLTLQLGHYSNYVGTHWWNLQDASLSYDPDAPLGEIQSDVVFREGQTSGGHATYTPRLIAMDLKGSLRTLRQEGSLYDPGKDTSAASWEGNLMLHKESPPSKNPFLEDLDTIDKGEILAESDSSFSPPHCSAAAVTVDSVNTQLSKLQKSYRLEGSVRVWSDFRIHLRIHLHPRTISVPRPTITTTGTFTGHSRDPDDDNHHGEAHRLEAFAQGESLLQGPVLEDLEDRLHFFVEECDYLQVGLSTGGIIYMWDYLHVGLSTGGIIYRLNRFNKTYVKRCLIAGDRSTEPQLISFYNKMELKQAMMLVESGSTARLPSLVSAVSLQNLQPKDSSQKRAIPSVSKKREQEIRKVLRANLQKTRQRLRSYSRHDLMIDPFEDNVSEVRFRKQRVEMERRMSHYLTVPAKPQERPSVRKVNFEPEHKVYTYDETESPNRSQSVGGSSDTSRPTNQRAAPKRPTNQSTEEEPGLSMSRLPRDPGPEDDADDAFSP
uniref:Protein misato homolog 1 n=1 Tax=Knipowitschia caucasica TaxID=637954 RepID=A0AAV2K2G0_KNICA